MWDNIDVLRQEAFAEDTVFHDISKDVQLGKLANTDAVEKEHSIAVSIPSIPASTLTDTLLLTGSYTRYGKQYRHYYQCLECKSFR